VGEVFKAINRKVSIGTSPPGNKNSAGKMSNGRYSGRVKAAKISLPAYHTASISAKFSGLLTRRPTDMPTIIGKT
jgi:hypothetical protein